MAANKTVPGRVGTRDEQTWDGMGFPDTHVNQGGLVETVPAPTTHGGPGVPPVVPPVAVATEPDPGPSVAVATEPDPGPSEDIFE